jgi:hypothetical protein
MSEALRKKFLRLQVGRGGGDITGEPQGFFVAQPQPCPRLVPVKLLVEPVPVALQGVCWETWGAA